MKNKEILKEIGLSDNEAGIYLILLDLGEATIYEISNYSKISRPNIYDIIKKLKEKGLVSEISKNNRIFVKPNSPKIISSILKNKEKDFLEILPTLNKKYSSSQVKPIIEIFQGPEGLKTLMNDMLKVKKEILIFNGASKDYILKTIPDFYLRRFLNEKKKLKIKTKILYSKNIEPIKGPYYTLKKLPDTVLSCVSYWTYGDRVAIGIWSDQLIIIRIISEDVAKTYREGIKLVWNMIK